MRAFHAKHYPHLALSSQFLYAVGTEQQATTYEADDDDGLGYYPDGVKRTLTDEQIALFRHSEIHTILRKRRLKKENADEASESDYEPEETFEAMDGVQTSSPSTTSGQTLSRKRSIDEVVVQSSVGTPDTGNGDDSHKLKNRKNQKLWKQRKRQRRDNKRRKLEAGRLSPPADAASVDESDEWDPWNQATGPDAQKDETIDLDY